MYICRYIYIILIILLLVTPDSLATNSTFSTIMDIFNSNNPINSANSSVSFSKSEAFEDLKIGKLFFMVNKKMKLGETEYAYLNITRENIYGGREILTNKYMAATLKGESFKIEPLSHEQQIIRENGSTSWAWRIAPLDSGIMVLELVVSIRTKIDENSWEVQDLPVYKEQILVESNTPYSVKTFLSDHWMYFLSGIGAFIAGVLLTLISYKYKKEPN